MRSSVEAAIAALELTASEHCELLDFQVHVLLHSELRPAMQALAERFAVELRRVGVTVYQACLDLSRLERKRHWGNPAEVVEAPNLAALHGVCLARLARIQAPARRRKLERIGRKIEKADQRQLDLPVLLPHSPMLLEDRCRRG